MNKYDPASIRAALAAHSLSAINRCEVCPLKDIREEDGNEVRCTRMLTTCAFNRIRELEKGMLNANKA